ncbi:hypothetical protein IF188_09740 [Microbacterium sp. NEAU-LLC]|uniref:Uncharacterized protein n=1 Tax=Microbacterium helvum TaxID=2773713 RepID=A0ABR8NQX8_9MICO|nr:hypothetical protein [Microbacterium helvum]MBD3941976.1 hypothetical protein [Microbacterium helvum]
MTVRPSTPDPEAWMRQRGVTEEELADGKRRLDDANAWINRVRTAAVYERDYIAAQRRERG